ncbi:SDR family NAD(P)-dependent oxidoreductase [Streptomyces sp. RK62]|uniref:SDR family NAD(P)-dependent oxidoreductase n=1 Tax=Streptomyces sp. RK62 TaxID=2824893 RepID=UPI001B397F0A|nr:SDR family oxidoreductase [Streptomyces sp. RK62]MBQ0997656.1 SDR family oxidoreductase [Streptomyces sp. RK62]
MWQRTQEATGRSGFGGRPGLRRRGAGRRPSRRAVVATSRTITPSEDADIGTVQGDIADPSTAERVASAAMKRFGRIDTLVNNAGIFIAKLFTEYTPEEYAAVKGVNLDGFFRLTQPSVEQMLRGIRSNAVSLDIIKTPMHSEENHAAFAELHPVGRMGEVSDIVDAVVHLENAHFVTGEILHVDGGQNVGH